MNDGADESQSQVDELLAQYMDRLDREEQVDVEEFLSRHPEHADELRELIEADHLLGQLNAPNLHDTVPPTIVPGGNTSDPRLGTRIRYVGDYELLDEIARGGMGIVYKARQLSLNRVVAIKMIRSGELAYDDEIQRFQNEAEAVARLQHPNIVSVHEVGQHDGHSYFSMDLVEGSNLSELVREHPLPVREAVRYVKQAAEAIQYAHEQGVLHRDIKPSNILVDKAGQVHITDFGLAKSVASDSSLTQTGQVLGTPSYMPPEQAAGNSALMGPASDVYSLGAVLYELITGRPPFAAATPVETIRQVLDKESLSPRLLNTEVPKDLETICLKCLEKSPTQRYLTGEELVDELDRFLEGKPILARPIGRISRTWRWCRHNLLVAGLAAMFAVSLLAGAVVSMYFAIEAGKRAADADREKLNAQVAERRADARRLASDSVQVLDDFPRRSLLLAIAAVKRTSDHGEPAVQQAEQALRDALGVVGGLGLAQDSPITKMGISPNSRWLVTGSEDGAVRIWDVTRLHESVEPNVTIAATDKVRRIYSISFSPDNKWLVAKTNRGIRLWNLDADVISAKPLTLQSGRSMAISSDSHWLVTGSDSAVRLFDLSLENPTAGPVRSICSDDSIELDDLKSISVSPDSRWLAFDCGLDEKGPYLVNLQTEKQRVKPVSLTVRERPNAKSFRRTHIVFSRDSRWLLQQTHFAIRRWSLTSEEFEYEEIPFAEGHGSPLLSPDGSWLLTRPSGNDREHEMLRSEPIQGDQTPHLVDLLTDSTRVIPLELANLGLAADATRRLFFSPDSHWLIARGQRKFVMWDLTSESPMSKPVVYKVAMDQILAISADARMMVTGASGYNKALLWNLEASKPAIDPLTLHGHDGPVRQVLFSQDSRWLVTGGRHPRIWSIPLTQKGAEPLILPEKERAGGYARSGRWAGFTADSERLVVARSDSARVWNRASSRIAHTPFVVNEWNCGLIAVSPDKRWIVSTSGNGIDSSVRLWDRNQKLDDIVETVLNESGVAITAVAVSIDSRWLAAGDRDGAATLWDLKSSDPAANPVVLKAHRQPITALAFSPDVGWLVTASEGATAQLWELSSKDVSQDPVTLAGHQGAINSVAISPSGEWMVTGSADATARLWSLAKPDRGNELAVLKEHADEIRSVSISPDGKWLATGCDDHLVRVWVSDRDEQQVPVVLRGHKSAVNSVAFSPNGQWLISASTDKTARIWNRNAADISSDPVVLKGHQAGIRSVDISPDSRWVVTNGDDDSGILWDLKSDDPAENPITLKNDLGVRSIDFDAERQLMYVGNLYQSLFVWDLENERTKYWTGSEAGFRFLKMTPNRHRMVLVFGGKARIYDLHSKNPAIPIHVSPGRDFYYANCGDVSDRWLATGGQTVRVWNLIDNPCQTPPILLKGNTSWITSVTISPDERWLATTSDHRKNHRLSTSPEDSVRMGDEDKTVRLWHLAGDAPRAVPIILRGHETAVTVSEFSPNGKWLATSSKSFPDHPGVSADSAFTAEPEPKPITSTTFLWRLEENNSAIRRTVLEVNEVNVTSFDFSLDGRWLAAACEDEVVRLWDLSVKNFEEPFMLRGHSGTIRNVTFSPNCRWLVSTAKDNAARLWDLLTSSPDANVTVLRGHRASVNSALFSPDSTSLITGSRDGTARVWDVTARDPSARSVVLGDRSTNESVGIVAAISPDGHFVVTRRNHRIQVWNLRISELIDNAQRVVGRMLTKEERIQYSVHEANE